MGWHDLLGRLLDDQRTVDRLVLEGSWKVWVFLNDDRSTEEFVGGFRFGVCVRVGLVIALGFGFESQLGLGLG